jgi:RHS repeat-associated protein
VDGDVPSAQPEKSPEEVTMRSPARLNPEVPFQLARGGVFLLFLLLVSGAAMADCSEGGYSGATRVYNKPLRVADPISASNGAYSFGLKPLELGGPFNLGFELTYRHDMHRWAPLPEVFWFSPMAMGHVGFAVEDKQYATIYLPSSDQISFQQNPDGTWRLTDPVVQEPGLVPYKDNLPAVRYELVETQGYVYLMDPSEQLVYIFEIWTITGGERQCRIAWIVDRNGNRLTYSYADGTSDSPTGVEDGLGRSLAFTYQKFASYWKPVLTRVTDGGGRTVDLVFENSGSDNLNIITLRSLIDPLGRATLFSYAGDCWGPNRIDSVQLPRGNAPYSQEFTVAVLDGNPYCRVGSQSDASGNTTDLTYEAATNRVTEKRPDGTTWKYEHFSFHGYPKSITDPQGKTTSFTKTAEEHLTSVTDRDGGITTFSYHPASGLLASVTNPAGRTLAWTYTAQPQTFTNPANQEQVTFTFYGITRTDLPDGTHEESTYDARGNLISATGRSGHTWTYEVNGLGKVTRSVNPEGGELLYTYNPDGTLASRRDSGTGLTTFSYDGHRRLIRTTHPDGTFAELAYDLADQVTSSTDELGHSTTFTYDANGNVVKVTDPLGRMVNLSPDAMDRVGAITDPAGSALNFTYDAAGRLSSSTDALGNVERFRYDDGGRLFEREDGAGKKWRWSHGAEGALATTSTPSGRSETFQTGSNGWLGGIADSQGNVSAVQYDSMGRPTVLTDRVGRATNYTYHDSGLLSGMTIPGAGSAQVGRNALGLPVQVTDFNGEEWTYHYTPEGRSSSFQDPEGNLWGYTYNDRGRLSRVTFPTGETADVAYDAAENETGWTYSSGAAVHFDHDAAGRLTASEGLQITYDARGNVDSTATGGGDLFGAATDAASRLTSVTYAGGLFTVTYTHDARNLLTRVEDSLSGTWVAFSYNDDGEISEVTRSNGATTAYGRDAGGRIVQISDGFVRRGSPVLQTYTRNAEGEITSAETSGAINPADYFEGENTLFQYDGANRIVSAGYTYDARGRCTASARHQFGWDGPGRLTAVDSLGLSFNGLSDPVSVTAGGASLFLHHNYALARTPVVAEAKGTLGNYSRFYVWSPDSTLLYSIEAGSGEVHHYHYDSLGSTIFLTDESGAIQDQYAYSPYGALLGHIGESDQPYRFSGKYGVRALADDIYLTDARGYDAGTGRFLSTDPSGMNLSDPRSLNLYQYAAQDPVNIIDPCGSTGWNANQTVYTSKTGQFVQTEKPHGNFLGGWKWVPNKKAPENPPPPEPKPPAKVEKLEGKKPDDPVPAKQAEKPPESVQKAMQKADPQTPQGEPPKANTPPPPQSVPGTSSTPPPATKSSNGNINLGGTELDPKPLVKAAGKIIEKVAINEVKKLVPGSFGPGLSTTFRLAGEAEKVLQVGKEMTVTVHELVEQRDRVKRDTGIDTSDIYEGRKDLAKKAGWFKETFPWLFW